MLTNRGIVLFCLTLSLTSMSMNTSAQDILTNVSKQGVIRKEQNPVNTSTLKVPKPKLFRSNPLRKTLILNGSDPNNTIDDEDIVASHRRPEVKARKPNLDDDLSDYVKWRLFLARTLAVMRAKQKWGI